jgi:hypothetical protein
MNIAINGFENLEKELYNKLKEIKNKNIYEGENCMEKLTKSTEKVLIKLLEITENGLNINSYIESICESNNEKEELKLRSALGELENYKIISLVWTEPPTCFLNGKAFTYFDDIKDFNRSNINNNININTLNNNNSSMIIGNVDNTNICIDNSINKTNPEIDEITNQIIKALEDNKIFDSNILKSINEMKDSAGTPRFVDKYNAFIQSAANHMTIIAPFIPLLTKILPLS